MKQLLKDYINLSKPRIVLLFVITGLTSIIMEGSLLGQPTKLWSIILGITLIGASANVINQFYDRDIDAIMERTAKKRPLALGKMSANKALIFGVVLGLAGTYLLWKFGNELAAFFGVFTIFYYIVIYTMWLKRRTSYNIVIGGAAGATAPLIGWAAATGRVSWVAFWLFAIIFMWTPPHFWALALVVKDEYKKAAVPMLPVVHGEKRTRIEIALYSLLLVPITLFPSIREAAGPVYTVLAVLLGGGFLYFAFEMFRRKDNRSAFKLFGYSIVYLLTLFIVMSVAALLYSSPARAAEELPKALQNVGIDEKTGQNIDLNLTFKDETGAEVPLKNYFNKGKPVALYLVYYGCPSLCGYFLVGVTESMKALPWTPGEQFEVVTLSFDPRETPELAGAKKKSLLKMYGRGDGPAVGWHFLTGSQENIAKLTQSVGFKYKYDKETNQYAHASAVITLTPEGKVSRYLYGISYKPMDLRLALNEAGNGKVGSLVDRFVMFCYHYDPQNKKYAIYAMNAMRAGGATTVFLMAGIFLIGFRQRRQWRKTQDHKETV